MLVHQPRPQRRRQHGPALQPRPRPRRHSAMSNTSRPRSKPPRRRSLPGPNIPRSPFLPAAPCPLARPFATRYSPLATHHSPHSRSSASGDAQDRPGPPKTTSYPPCISVPRPRRTGYAHPRPAIQNKGLQPHHPPPPIARSPPRRHLAGAAHQLRATPGDCDGLLYRSLIGAAAPSLATRGLAGAHSATGCH